MKKRILFSSLLLALSYGVCIEANADSLPSALSSGPVTPTVKNQNSNINNTPSLSVPSSLLSNPVKTEVKNNNTSEKIVKPVNLTTVVKSNNKENAINTKLPSQEINKPVNNVPPTVHPVVSTSTIHSEVKNNTQHPLNHIRTTDENHIKNNNIEQSNSINKNKPSVNISVNNPFTGNNALKANLISDYNIWDAKNKVLKEMVKYQKEKNLLQEAEAASGSEAGNPNSPVNQAENKEVSELQNEISSMQEKISSQNNKMQSMEKINMQKKKEIANKPKLVSVIRYNKEYTAIIKTGKITKSYNVNGMVNGDFIQAISPNSVTFNNGKVINLSTDSSGYIAKAAWSGYPKKDGLGEDSRLSSGPSARQQPMHIPTYPGEPVQPYHLPKGTLPSMN